MDLAARVADFLRVEQLDTTPGVLAVSGGPDSVALAHAVAHLSPRPPVVLAHLDHKLRGAESAADATFVQRLAAAWNLPCHVDAVDIAFLASERRANLEETARGERYRFLAKVARSQNAFWAATGHSADDQAETVLFRLLRGSGLAGLAGMRRRRSLDGEVELVRPLLSTGRAEILAYLEMHAVRYRSDASNLDLAFARNRIRHQLLPQLAAGYNPAIVDVLCRLSYQAREAQDDIEARAGELLQQAELPRAGAMLVFRVDVLNASAAHVVCEVFRQLWHREGWPEGAMCFEAWHRLLDVAAGHATAIDLPGPVRARRRDRVLQLERLAPGS